MTDTVGPSSFDWRAALRRHRRESQISQRALATRSGLSLAAIKSYESGRRRPSREALLCMIDAMGVPREDANGILADAGYAVQPSEILSGRLQPLTASEIDQELRSTPWPAFVTNQAFDVLHANLAIERTLNARLADLSEPGERNLLARMTDPAFAPRLKNWDEVLLLMMGLAKGDPRRRQSLDHPIPWLEGPVKRLLQGDPEMVKLVGGLWSKAPHIEHRLRHRYRVVWEVAPGSLLHFTGSFMPVDVWSELHWNEWIPADASTWRWIELDTRT